MPEEKKPKNEMVTRIIAGTAGLIAVGALAAGLNVWKTQAVMAEDVEDVEEFLKDHKKAEKEQTAKIDKVKGEVIEVRAEQKAQRRILERIERKVSD